MNKILAKSRTWLTFLALVLIALVIVLPACTSVPSSTTSTTSTTTNTSTATSPAPYTINTHASATLGPYLVDGRSGMTLYWNNKDAPGVSNVSAALLANWPQFYAANVVVPSSLNASDFGSITTGGSPQTTYKQYPLYYFIRDTAPGDTLGQGLLDEWFVVNPSASAPPASTTTTTSSTTTTTTTPPTTTTATPTATTTTKPTTATSATTTAAATYQTLASAGQSTYSSTCAICHGTNGGGSQVCPVTIWGSGSTLGTYNGATLFTDAQGMYNYISQRMPLTAPGSLTSQQYIELLSYILIQNKIVTPSTTFDESKLSSISIP